MVTRAEEQAGELARALEAAGAKPILCPTIRIAPPDDWGPLDQALDRLDTYRWVVFTSSNGVRSALSRLESRGLGREVLAEPGVAAVGASTAGELAAHGIEASFVPEQERSRSLAETLPDVVGARVLLTRADIATSVLADTLLARGADLVDDVVAYRTVLQPPTGDAVGELRQGVDGITFTSPSTVRGFVAIGEERDALLAGAIVVTLGPATTEAAKTAGLAVAAEAGERSMKGLVDALKATLGSSVTLDGDEGI